MRRQPAARQRGWRRWARGWRRPWRGGTRPPIASSLTASGVTAIVIALAAGVFVAGAPVDSSLVASPRPSRSATSPDGSPAVASSAESSPRGVPGRRLTAGWLGGSTWRVTRHVVVLGDSTALNLSYALAATAPAGVEVDEHATFGCGLAIGSEISASPPEAGLPSAPACNEDTPPRSQWPALDARAVAGTTRRDVVLFLAGHDDTTGIREHGRWTNIDSPPFRQEELRRLEQLRAIATTHGARLVLLTMPCTDTGLAYHRGPQPDDRPRRRALFNNLLRQAARDSQGRVVVVDFASLLCPGGRFTMSIGGVQVRALDGVHTPSYAAGNPYVTDAPAPTAERFYRWLGPRLWPAILRTRAA